MDSTYGWLVTKDHFSGDNPHSRQGTSGPSGVSDEMFQQLIDGKGDRWRCYDDDRNLIYEGLMLGFDADSVSGFEPLDDFGTPDAGCTYIKWRDPDTGDWAIL